jgi:hypothetical protein
MIDSTEISDEERDIQDPFGASTLHAEPTLTLSLCNLMRTLHESYNLGVSDAEHGTATGILHDTQVALDLPHFEQFPAIHPEGAGVIVVP